MKFWKFQACLSFCKFINYKSDTLILCDLWTRTVNSTILMYFEKNIKRTNRHIFKVEFRQNDTYLLLETQTKKYFKTKDLSTNIFSEVACFLWLRFLIIVIYYTHLRFSYSYLLIIMQFCLNITNLCFLTIGS